tara:strand:+ start:259 stop:561 length:303 start_codon:yes stop_codon:yes gene_type:complete
MKKRKLTATLPDGGIATRTTNKTYTHVIAVKTGSGQWDALGWAGSPELAAKRLATETNHYQGGWGYWDYYRVNLAGKVVPFVGPLPEFKGAELEMIEVDN